MQTKAIVVMGLTAALVATTLSGCAEKVKAPRDLGTCYFIGHTSKDEYKFNVVSKNEPDLEHCAARLYNVRMDLLRTGTAGTFTAGSYQGNFLFLDNHEIRYAQRYEGPAYPLLVKAPDGRLVAPGSVMREEDLPDKQVTVEVPKNLPKMPSDDKK
jgi:hypothetical protein